MSALALFVALGGTSFATVKASDGGTQPTAKVAKKKKVKRGPAGPQGPQGAAGQNGTAGTARAYARVEANCAAIGADCPLSKSKGVSRVHHLDVGEYCITAPGISTVDTPAALTVEYDSTVDPESLPDAVLAISAGGCANASDFHVLTERPNTFTSDVHVDNVGFTIVIP